MKLFHWGLMLRYMVYGVLPLLLLFAAFQRFGGGDVGVFIVVLAALLPFIAIGWLGYQHYRHRGK
ncbi:MAG: hypothetical protein WCS70_01070 [Verrucomicrobiota bacterium]